MHICGLTTNEALSSGKQAAQRLQVTRQRMHDSASTKLTETGASRQMSKLTLRLCNDLCRAAAAGLTQQIDLVSGSCFQDPGSAQNDASGANSNHMHARWCP